MTTGPILVKTDLGNFSKICQHIPVCVKILKKKKIGKFDIKSYVRIGLRLLVR